MIDILNTLPLVLPRFSLCFDMLDVIILEKWEHFSDFLFLFDANVKSSPLFK